ncbi:MAG: hypothetical protein FWH41_02265, partial [Treponema sp.]|nr:hypothetical protein [Treponema sp.]
LPEILFLFEEIDIKPLRGKKFPFEKIPVENGSKEKKQQVSPWILFLIIKTLMRKISGQALGNVPNSDVRALYRFLTLGIESFRIGSEQ